MRQNRNFRRFRVADRFIDRLPMIYIFMLAG
jgi:hypothetical protein